MQIYTDRIIPKAADAITLGFVILIRPQCKGDAGVLAHEQVHVRQRKESWGLFWPRYLLSKNGGCNTKSKRIANS